MKVTKTPFEGLLILEPHVLEDVRGYFYEAYNNKTFQEAGIVTTFVQDNQSRSRRGVVRGLHFQRPPFAHTKLVRVLSGLIQDVVVDLRKAQPTFGKHYSIDLSAESNRQLLVPKGFAHGFLVLSESADVLYKCDEYYHPEAEGSILFNDPALAIEWRLPAKELTASERDLRNSTFTKTEFIFR